MTKKIFISTVSKRKHFFSRDVKHSENKFCIDCWRSSQVPIRDRSRDVRKWEEEVKVDIDLIDAVEL